MFKILAVGVATVDIINTVEHYPHEDDELRAINRSMRRGGNATNTLVVLSQLGHYCAWAGSIANDIYADIIRQDLALNAIDMNWVTLFDESATPVSCITMSEQTGSRTIVHYRDLPEYSFNDFSSIDLGGFDWLHFEGRNIDQTLLMLRSLDSLAVPISIEIEKPRDNIESLYEFADVLFYSRVFVRHLGYQVAEAFLKSMHASFPNKEHYCAWGEDGAYAIGRDGVVHVAEVSAPGQVLDTIGAGDVFNAAVINAKLCKRSLANGLRDASNLATKKCMQYGFSGLLEHQHEI